MSALKEMRIRAGIQTTTAAARMIGVPRGSYVQHENGLRPITLRAARKYAAYFKVPMSVFIAEADDVLEVLIRQQAQILTTLQALVRRIDALHADNRRTPRPRRRAGKGLP